MIQKKIWSPKKEIRRNFAAQKMIQKKFCKPKKSEKFF